MLVLTHTKLLEGLLAALPSDPLPGELASGDQADQARATFAGLVSLALTREGEEFQKAVGSVANCPNCGKPDSNERSPYCSAQCREEASFVRHFRSALHADLATNHEKQAMFGQLFWTLIGGGYPLRQSIIPERNKLMVLKKSGGRCELCSQPATKVEHIRTGCNRPINLRAACDACEKTRPFGDASLLESEAVQAFLEEFVPRLASPLPLRLCDDPNDWDWRAFLAARKAH